MKEYDKMTVKELVAELTSRGVSFNKKARKADLLEILRAETGGVSKKLGANAEGVEAAVKTGTEKKPAPKAAPEPKGSGAKKAGGKTKARKEVPVDSGYAIIRTGGKQYQVSPGAVVRVEKIAGNIGDTVELKDVLAVFRADSTRIGQPIVEGAVVIARIVAQDKARKVLVFKKKRRKGYRVKRGHRQMFTALEIADISI